MKEFAMVLSGGGAKGAYQVGAFSALNEFPISINMVSGSSIGGINALLFAILNTSKINELWNNLQFKDFFEEDDNPFDGLSSRNTLEKLLRENIDMDKIKNAIPIFNTICVDSLTPEYKILNNKNIDDIIKIVLATSALPVIYSKVDIDNKKYQDGGVADNLPVNPLYNLGTENLLSISLSKDLRVDKDKYIFKNLIEIYPFKDLGGLFSGTMNFNSIYIEFLKELGYMDCKRVLSNYFGIYYASNAERDFNIAYSRYQTNKIKNDINYNLDYLKKFL